MTFCKKCEREILDNSEVTLCGSCIEKWRSRSKETRKKISKAHIGKDTQRQKEIMEYFPDFEFMRIKMK